MKTVPSPNPHGIRLYDIVSIDRIEDVDGVWWLEAATACGHVICAIKSADSFSVYVLKDARYLRQYSGGPSSDAAKVFDGIYDGYLTSAVDPAKLDTTR